MEIHVNEEHLSDLELKRINTVVQTALHTCYDCIDLLICCRTLQWKNLWIYFVRKPQTIDLHVFVLRSVKSRRLCQEMETVVSLTWLTGGDHCRIFSYKWYIFIQTWVKPLTEKYIKFYFVLFFNKDLKMGQEWSLMHDLHLCSLFVCVCARVFFYID